MTPIDVLEMPNQKTQKIYITDKTGEILWAPSFHVELTSSAQLYNMGQWEFIKLPTMGSQLHAVHRKCLNTHTALKYQQQ